MSKVEHVNFCYICDLGFETRKQFAKNNLSDGHLNMARKEYEDEVYNSDEDNTKDMVKHERSPIVKTELKLKLKLKQVLMIISTLKLGMNVKNVMKNLGIKYL